tara:strand:+ start:359 stop:589 length:231 start_codon:yes stop_codon:yes gene_type:complete
VKSRTLTKNALDSAIIQVTVSIVYVRIENISSSESHCVHDVVEQEDDSEGDDGWEDDGWEDDGWDAKAESMKSETD